MSPTSENPQPKSIELLSMPEVKRSEPKPDKFGVPCITFSATAEVRGKLIHNIRTGEPDPLIASVRKEIGVLDAHMISWPEKIVYVSWVGVYEPNLRGQKIGSMLLNEVEQLIKEENAIGILKDSIPLHVDRRHEDWLTARKRFSMYERRRWKEVHRGSSRLVFNCPEEENKHLDYVSDGIVDSYLRGERIYDFG